MYNMNMPAINAQAQKDVTWMYKMYKILLKLFAKYIIYKYQMTNHLITPTKK